MTAWTRRVALLVAFYGAATAAATCTPSEVIDYCEEKCDCEDCNDSELEECEIVRQARIDVADNYDCGDEYQELLDCQLDKSDCQRNTGEDDYYGVDCDANGCDCADESEDYSDCEDRASDLESD